MSALNGGWTSVGFIVWLTSFVPHLQAADQSPPGAKPCQGRAQWNNQQEFKAFFGCDIEFGADIDEVAFPGTDQADACRFWRSVSQ